MDDLNQSELLTEQMEASAAKTERLPRILLAAHQNEEAFRAGQSKILEMIAANAPLSEILTSLVLLIEAQSPEMLCSVLLLSDDGNHIRHGAARRVFPSSTSPPSTALPSGQRMDRAGRLCTGACR